MIRILQLDSDQAFRGEVAAYFQRLPDFYYACGESGAELMDLVEREAPQVVLVDLHLPPLGGLAALAQLRARWNTDQVKVILSSTTAPGEELLAQVAQAGGDYFLLRPVDLVVLEKRVKQLLGAEQAVTGEITLRQVQEICLGYFERLGLPPHYKGYRYLIEGIWLVVLHPSWLNSVTRTLYPAIAQRFGVNPAQVERAMRYAIDVTWEKGNLDQLYELFPFVKESKGKPTNSVFIGKLADLIRLEVT